MYDWKAMYFEMWGDEATVSTPTLDYPTHLLANVYLNSDGLLQMQWSDADDEDISYYTVYFGLKGETLSPQTDRSRYSIVSLFMFLGEQIGGENYYSDIFEFSTIAFNPPQPTGTPINGLNGITTIKRLVAAADNKIWYET
jgi:hypothetical protein